MAARHFALFGSEHHMAIARAIGHEKRQQRAVTFFHMRAIGIPPRHAVLPYRFGNQSRRELYKAGNRWRESNFARLEADRGLPRRSNPSKIGVARGLGVV